jgi:hypothetical protein
MEHKALALALLRDETERLVAAHAAGGGGRAWLSTP